MPIELNIKKIHFPDVPNGIGKDRVVRELMGLLPSIFDKINEDLLLIVEKGLTPDVFANPSEELFKPLDGFFNRVQNLPNSKIKSELQKHIRIFVLVLRNRLEQVSKEIKADLEMALNTISGAIGIVPSLNDTVTLPPENYLPKQFKKSKEQWEKILYISPSRQSKENPVDFFTRGDEEGQISSVRRYLIFIDKNPHLHNSMLRTAFRTNHRTTTRNVISDERRSDFYTSNEETS